MLGEVVLDLIGPSTRVENQARHPWPSSPFVRTLSARSFSATPRREKLISAGGFFVQGNRVKLSGFTSENHSKWDDIRTCGPTRAETRSRRGRKSGGFRGAVEAFGRGFVRIVRAQSGQRNALAREEFAVITIYDLTSISLRGAFAGPTEAARELLGLLPSLDPNWGFLGGPLLGATA